MVGVAVERCGSITLRYKTNFRGPHKEIDFVLAHEKNIKKDERRKLKSKPLPKKQTSNYFRLKHSSSKAVS